MQKSEEFEVGNGKYYQHPKKSPIFFSRSVKSLVRMVRRVQKSDLVSLGRESQKLTRFLAPCTRLFRGSQPGGPKTPSHSLQALLDILAVLRADFGEGDEMTLGFWGALSVKENQTCTEVRAHFAPPFAPNFPVG